MSLYNPENRLDYQLPSNINTHIYTHVTTFLLPFSIKCNPLWEILLDNYLPVPSVNKIFTANHKIILGTREEKP